MMLPRVLTMGTFAIPHIGHAAFLRRCEAFGSLIVGVNSDAFVLRYKGAVPLFDETERMALIADLGYRVVLNDGPGRALIEEVHPDVITVGSDWSPPRDYFAQIDVDADWLTNRHISLVYVPRPALGFSSSEIARRAMAVPA